MSDTLCIGVDIGGTWVRLIAQNQRGVRSDIIARPIPRTAAAIVDTVVSVAQELAAGRTISSLAIGLPGQTGREVPAWIPNLRFLDSYPLAATVSARLGAMVTLLNDADATLIAESREGAAVGQSNVLLVAFGTGIGGSIQVNDQIMRGRSGCAGSFGWLSLDDSEPDADHGQWEQRASGMALDVLAEPWGSAAQLLQAADAGELRAKQVIDTFGALVGRGLAALASIFDPDLIVFSGGLTQSFDFLEGSITAARSAYASPAGRDVPLVLAKLGIHAGVVGALHAAIDSNRELEAMG